MGVLGAMTDDSRPMRPHEWRRPKEIFPEMATIASDQLGFAQAVSDAMMRLQAQWETLRNQVEALEIEVTRLSKRS